MVYWLMTQSVRQNEIAGHPRDERDRSKVRRPTLYSGMRFRENQRSQWLTAQTLTGEIRQWGWGGTAERKSPF